MKIRLTSFLRILAICLLGLTSTVFAGDGDIYLQAKQAYQTRNLPQLVEATEALKQRRSPLLPYLQYWQMILTMDQLSYYQVQAFLQENNESLLSQRVRELWLKRLGRVQFWDQFVEMRAQMPMYYSMNDVGNQCYQVQAGIALDDPNAYEDGKKLLLAGKDLPADCQGMLEALQQVGVLDEKLLLTLYRDALFSNKTGLAKVLAKRSNKTDAGLLKQIDDMAQNPTLTLKKGGIQERSPYARALYLYAIHRQAKADTGVAKTSYQKYSGLLDNDEKQLAQAYIALEAARKHEPEALQGFGKVNTTLLSNEQWEWYARSALRQQDWGLVLKVINDMPAGLADESTWRYWKARALMAKGHPSGLQGLPQETAPYLIQSRIESQARPRMPASSTVSSATSGMSTTVSPPPTLTLSVPRAWPRVKGATSGSGRATWVWTLAELPAGTAITMASGRPSLTVPDLPFQTAGETTAWPASNSLTASNAV